MNLVKIMVVVSKIRQINIIPCSRKKIKRVTNGFAIDFKCRKCKGGHASVEDQAYKLREDVKKIISRR